MSLISTEKVLLTAGAEPLSNVTMKCAQVHIEAKRGNAALLTVGSSTVTAGKGAELIKPVASVAPVPLKFRSKGGNGFDLNLIYVIGTTGDGVNVLYEEY